VLFDAFVMLDWCGAARCDLNIVAFSLLFVGTPMSTPLAKVILCCGDGFSPLFSLFSF
jgi:hypothetical protein